MLRRTFLTMLALFHRAPAVQTRPERKMMSCGLTVDGVTKTVTFPADMSWREMAQAWPHAATALRRPGCGVEIQTLQGNALTRTRAMILRDLTGDDSH